MKHLYKMSAGLVLALLLQLNAYTQTIVGKIFVTSSDQIAVFGLDQEGKLDTTKRFAVKKSTKFSIVGFDADNNILITFWRYYSKDSTGKTIYTRTSTMTKAELNSYPEEKAFIGSWANFKRFAIKPTVLNSSCKEYYGTQTEFTWGVMTLPIKARMGNGDDKFFDFEERLNLGFVFGLKQQLKGYSPQALNYLAGFGITSVKTDSITLKDVKLYEGKSALALSIHAGSLYQFDNFQVGLFIGADFVPGKVGRTWKYQGKPWIGLAIGVSLFSKNLDGGSGNNDTESRGGN